LVSLFFSSIAMFFLSRFSGFVPLLFLTFALGGGAAGVHISMATLPMVWFQKEHLGRALGVVTGGTGLGIALTGLLLPSLIIYLGKEGWRDCWVLMASVTFGVLLISLFLLKERPENVSPSASKSPEDKQHGDSFPKSEGMTIRTIFGMYFVFGFAYIIYATYFVAYMVEEIHFSSKVSGDIWSLSGWLSMASGWIWGFLSDRWGRRKALLWNNGMISVAAFLPLLLHQPFFFGVSAFLFGLTFLGTITIIAAMIGDRIFEKRASVYGLLTLIHGIGQFLGTTLGGYLKDLTGSFHLTLWISLFGFIVCFLIAFINKKE
jgi:MFS family permease